jgi:hypothetical protein
VARALLLQSAIRRAHRLTSRLLSQIDAARRELRVREQESRDAARDSSPVDPRTQTTLTKTVRAISHIVALLADASRLGGRENAHEHEHEKAADDIIELEDAATAALDALSRRPLHRMPLQSSLGWLERRFLPRVSVNVHGLGIVPVVSLAGGALCLLASVLLLAGSSQPRFIWISCTAIAVGMLTFSIVPTSNPRSKLMHCGSYGQNANKAKRSPQAHRSV